MSQPIRHALRPVGLESDYQADRVFRVEQQAVAPLDRGWDAIVAASGWSRWLPDVERASYDVPPTFGFGTVRRSSVGGVEYAATMRVRGRGRQRTDRIDPREKLGFTPDGTPLAQRPANLRRDAMCGLERFLAGPH